MSSGLVLSSSAGWQRIMDSKHELSPRATYALVLLHVNKVRGVVDPGRAAETRRNPSLYASLR
jgi:hypothetical protein